MRTRAVLTTTLPFWYIRQTRSGTQAVRDWSAKPSLVGSTPIHSLKTEGCQFLAAFCFSSPLKLSSGLIIYMDWFERAGPFFIMDCHALRARNDEERHNSCTPAQAASTPQPHKAAVGSGSK